MVFCEYKKEKNDHTRFIHKFKCLIAGLWFCEAAKGSGVMYKRANCIRGFIKAKRLALSNCFRCDKSSMGIAPGSRVWVYMGKWFRT